MKVLLIHSEDDPEKGPWASLPWDRIVDLGLGGVNTYARWQRQFGCPVTNVDSLRNGFDDFRRVRSLLGLGCGRLTDEHGLDWWEITSLLLHGEMETLILLQRFAQTVESGDEVYVSRPGLHASLLQQLCTGRVNIFPLRRGAEKRGLGHYLRVSNKLSAQQIIDVFWDKYDAGYQFRGRLARKRQPSTRPVVLLPTAYVNVSRTGIAYANSFPEENFLLVATRQSGWVEDPPKNVTSAWLSSYASVRDRSAGNADMESRWQSLLQDLGGVPELEILHRLGYLDSFPRRFRRGLEVRDAWRNVLDTEPVQAVLCADDSNPYTRIPLLLARARGLPTVACHHGALDGRYVFKRSYGDVIWVKGKMEEDYLVRKCGVPQEKVEIGAPALPANWNTSDRSGCQDFRPHLLFISEAFDVSDGRPEEFYRDILPPLADLALATGREADREVASGGKRTRTRRHAGPNTFPRAEKRHAHCQRPAHRGSSGIGMVRDHGTFHGSGGMRHSSDSMLPVQVVGILAVWICGAIHSLRSGYQSERSQRDREDSAIFGAAYGRHEHGRELLAAGRLRTHARVIVGIAQSVHDGSALS